MPEHDPQPTNPVEMMARAHNAQLAVNALGAGKPRSDLEKILEFLQREGGMVSIVCDPPDRNRNHDPEQWQFSVGMTFGREAEDSDMAGGASYSIGTDLAACLADVVQEAIG